MEELIVNLHMHTTYSDGRGSHNDIVQAGLKAGLDVAIVTDHNVLVKNREAYFWGNARQLLLLIGEEVHDRVRTPQNNHLLIFGHSRELASFAPDTQNLIDQAKKNGGLTFLAHPYEHALPLFGEGAFGWVNWEVHGFDGIELWNGLSELKAVIKNRLQAVFYAFFPEFIARGPEPETLRKWDELLQNGSKVVAVGGSDAHSLKIHMGPLQKTIFPYDFHFRAINTHILTPTALTGELEKDRQMVLEALGKGHAFIGYDLPSNTKGFRFTVQGKEHTAMQGDTLQLNGGATLQIKLPGRCECVLLKNGKIAEQWFDREVCTYITTEPGVYRVECYLQFLGKRRGWIFSNPIYLQS
ncbi:MAG: PHP domain-containing protein [Anaerolineaceae bacterium]|nr:PHP domain-containing protein [Anaerolineaceae bacterium]